MPSYCENLVLDSDEEAEMISQALIAGEGGRGGDNGLRGSGGQGPGNKTKSQLCVEASPNGCMYWESSAWHSKMKGLDIATTLNAT